MVSGSCNCGALTYDFTGDIGGFAACHCVPCRKTSGTGASWNLMIPASNWSAKGKTKTWKRKGDSGQDVTYYNCDECSSLVWVEADAVASTKLLKAGTVDDEKFMAALGKPNLEIYCKNMTTWEEKVEGAQHFDVSF